MNDLEIQFAQNQSQQTISKITSQANFLTIQKTITKILDSEEHIAYCEEHQRKMYHFLQDNEYPKGIYRVCESEYYKAGIANWETIFSIKDFDNLLNDDVYLDSYLHLTEYPNRILLNLSSQGKDTHYTLEFDISSKNVVTDGFNFPLAKSFVHWRDINSVWLSPAWENSQITSSGYSKQVWLLQRGQSFSDATLVFEGEQDDIFVEAWRYLDVNGAHLDIIKQSHSFYQVSYYVVQENLHSIPLQLPDSCNICGYLHSYLLVHLRHDWHKDQRTFKAGSVIAIKLQKGQLKNSISLFTPNKKQVVESVETSQDCIFIHYLDHVRSQAKVLLFKNDNIIPINFPKLKTINFELIDQPWCTNLFYIAANDLIHEPIFYVWDAEFEELSVLRKQKPLFKTQKLSIEQHMALSTDGISIPYFWCGSQHIPSPTLVYCYGGFAVNELPHYMPIIGKLWLEQGFSLVIANIRGGAELGEDWHQQAVQQNKHKSIQDLIAIIQDLQYTQKTSPHITAIQGASNGGLIVANAMVDVPNLLKAVLCEVPIIDIQHYTKYASGHLWIAEYGDPADKKISAYLNRINVLKKIATNIRYPELLITTNLTDDRVDPKHAILLQKKMLEYSHNSYLICHDSGGHESLNSQDKYINELAYLWAFLYNALNLDFNPNPLHH